MVEHLPVLYRAARAWCGSREEAEDLVQETWARVLARRRLLRGEDDLGYLLRAMRNTLVSQRRAASRRPQTTPLVDELAVGAHPGDDPAEEAERRQVYAAIHELPEEFRDALIAVDIVGLSYREAARALGVRKARRASSSRPRSGLVEGVWGNLEVPPADRYGPPGPRSRWSRAR